MNDNNEIKEERGRPRSDIDFELVRKMFMAGALGTEVAAHLKVCYATLARRVEEEKGMLLSEYMRECKEAGNVPLRVKLYKMALNGNVPVGIFLAKNRLGYSDNPEAEKENQNVTIILKEWNAD